MFEKLFLTILQMKKFILPILFLFTVTIGFAQSQNALDFDGIDDEVIVPGASALIAGSSQLSLTCWVYPTNAAPGFPDFDGFAGFRNNFDCDFYVMQVSPATAIEARFTNSSGTVYTITNQGLVINTWQHLAVTYDGLMLRLFIGGVLADSTPASGTIAVTNEAFHMGALPYFATPYMLTGQLDEISLFNRALTPSEIACIAQESVNASDPGCLLFYTCNQGVANGVNASITALEDESGHIDGTLNNFALISTFSNFVGGINNAASFAYTICQGDYYQFGTDILTEAGSYYNTQPLNGGCGNLQELNLFVIAVDTAVTQAGETLTANAAGATYQWADCNNGYAIIPGATGQTFSPVSDGSYALIITSGSCSDTSACYYVTNVGIGKNDFSKVISVFPNPVKDAFLLKNISSEQITEVKIIDALGKTIAVIPFANGDQLTVDASSWMAGIYFLEVSSGDGSLHHKLVKD